MQNANKRVFQRTFIRTPEKPTRKKKIAKLWAAARFIWMYNVSVRLLDKEIFYVRLRRVTIMNKMY